MFLAIPLGYLMHLCYTLSSNYGIAIILFAIISKILLFPANLLAQKNAIRMVKIKPKLNEVKRLYSGDKDRINEEYVKLYKSEKYNPFIALLPLFLQIFIVIGLIRVLYNPLQYLSQIQQIDFNFLGLNLSDKPSISNPSPLFLIPIFSSSSSFLMCFTQSRINVLEREQSAAYNWGMTSFFTCFSFFFPFMVPAGVGLYWISSNLFSVPMMFLLNIVYNPKKYIEHENRLRSKPINKTLLKVNRQREKADLKRFYEAGTKRLVFYSEQSGFYKYFKSVLEYILENSDITIHYVTSDPNDAIFKMENSKLIPYYIGEKALISFMLKLDTDMMVMTVPDLHKYHIKRSMVRKDIFYVYMFHAMWSTHMAYREGAFDYYDIIFCVGQYQLDEILAREKILSLQEKNLVPLGYGQIDDLIARYEIMKQDKTRQESILIAPSWQQGNIMESCLDELLSGLLDSGYQIIVRPHPEFIKRFPEKMNIIIDKYKDRIDDSFIIETDFSSNNTILTAGLLITDWSGISCEYAFATKRPCLFINTPMKVMNKNYGQIKLTPIEISLRNKIGVSLDIDKLELVKHTVDQLFKKAVDYRDQITETLENTVFNIGRSGEAGGQYIINTLAEKQLKKK